MAEERKPFAAFLQEQRRGGGAARWGVPARVRGRARLSHAAGLAAADCEAELGECLVELLG